MANIYVTMTVGKTGFRINKLIFECNDREAPIVEQNALAQGYKFVNIAIKKPYYSDKYFPVYETRETQPQFYRTRGAG